MSSQVAFFAGAVVLFAAGVAGLRRRSLTPGRGLITLAVAAAVGALAYVGSGYPSGWYAGGIVLSVTVAGALMGVAVVTAPVRKIKD